MMNSHKGVLKVMGRHGVPISDEEKREIARQSGEPWYPLTGEVFSTPNPGAHADRGIAAAAKAAARQPIRDTLANALVLLTFIALGVLAGLSVVWVIAWIFNHPAGWRSNL